MRNHWLLVAILLFGRSIAWSAPDSVGATSKDISKITLADWNEIRALPEKHVVLIGCKVCRNDESPGMSDFSRRTNKICRPFAVRNPDESRSEKEGSINFRETKQIRPQ